MVYVVMEWGDDYHGSVPVGVFTNQDEAKACAADLQVNQVSTCGSETCDHKYWYTVHKTPMEEEIEAATAPPKHRMLVQTDLDFSIRFKGKLYSEYSFFVLFDSPEELDQIEILGPYGTSRHTNTKCSELVEAIKRIQQNPRESFDTTGGNRGVVYDSY